MAARDSPSNEGPDRPLVVNLEGAHRDLSEPWRRGGGWGGGMDAYLGFILIWPGQIKVSYGEATSWRA